MAKILAVIGQTPGHLGRAGHRPPLGPVEQNAAMLGHLMGRYGMVNLSGFSSLITSG